MADHMRKQIRDAAVAALTGLPTTGSNVFPSRVREIPVERLPALAVYTLNEESERDAMGPPGTAPLARVVELAVAAVAEEAAGLDDRLDQICAEVEGVLGGTTFSGLVKGTVLEGTEVTIEGDKRQPLGVARMTLSVLYRTPEGDPTTAA
ncbi:hypothetical protein [Pelagibius sp.]|uniref:hypothetical protein n=1 Tax=Pelagibius sp. TaxID=1931238 RepID=UPI002605227F|nr:hypothetical protein [Pelagibius sp.]